MSDGFLLLNFSIVITAESHNPTILNPDFLWTRDIVRNDWHWEIKQPVLVSPLMSTVSYTNGVSITLEQEKFQVIDPAPGDALSDSRIHEIAERFVSTLPHVKYTGIGTNFVAGYPVTQPPRFLIERFLAPGSWRELPLMLLGGGVKLTYAMPNEQGHINVALDPGRMKLRGETEHQEGLIVSANFHRELDARKAVEQVGRAMSEVVSDLEIYQNMFAELLAHGSVSE